MSLILSGVVVPCVQLPPPVASSVASATAVSQLGMETYKALRKAVVSVLSTQTLSSEIELRSSLSSTLVQEENNARMAANVINIFLIYNYSNR